MGPMYSTTWNPDTFEDNWTRGIRTIEPLNQGFGDFMRTFDFTDRLHEIRCPTLVLGAAHDWICPPAHSEILARHMPRSHLKILANSGHMLASDENEAYLAAVRGFLTYPTP
jgi:proline iminopeptidase